jgi:hypothetical protein
VGVVFALRKYRRKRVGADKFLGDPIWIALNAELHREHLSTVERNAADRVKE